VVPASLVVWDIEERSEVEALPLALEVSAPEAEAPWAETAPPMAKEQGTIGVTLTIEAPRAEEQGGAVALP
jgi:hypothetical protein